MYFTAQTLLFQSFTILPPLEQVQIYLSLLALPEGTAAAELEAALIFHKCGLRRQGARFD